MDRMCFGHSPLLLSHLLTVHSNGSFPSLLHPSQNHDCWFPFIDPFSLIRPVCCGNYPLEPGGVNSGVNYPLEPGGVDSGVNYPLETGGVDSGVHKEGNDSLNL